jgi:chromosome segregation protein
VYLKSIEIIGFKSFADRTRMTFEPGMIAIVGPNGCGKSNVSDAIRWVLGEQRPTALRCTKLGDVIFNGTDKRKALGMAEVSITFSDCEGVLETEFNEVTITRRVYRSGEGQYFLNKTPCRLRDIQRLLMGTGIGTTSYSVMAQGQIDVILSSRPEDRRLVFEEAAGITKFKADRKEALRKLDQTEANLLRLTDVIREVRRQIGTLQRQAGKAQKYKELRDELRGLDIFVTRRRMAVLEKRIAELDTLAADLAARLDQQGGPLAAAEAEAARIREEVLQTEQQIGILAESAAQADSRLLRAQEVIRVNEQRIAEYRTWAERDNNEINQTQAQIEAVTIQQTELERHIESLNASCEQSQREVAAAQQQYDEQKMAIDSARRELQLMRDSSVARERRIAQIQNEIAEIESSQRALLLQHERLSSEYNQLEQHAAATTKTRDALRLERDSLQAIADESTAALDDLQQQIAITEADQKSSAEITNRLLSQLAARQAQLEVLSDPGAADDELPPGTQMLLDPANPLKLPADAIIGPMAEQFSAPADLRLALEAALRAWLDAVVVRDDASARAVIEALLNQGRPAAARLILANSDHPLITVKPPAGLTPLISLIKPSPQFAAAAQTLLSNVFLAETIADIPSPLPSQCTVVTRNGIVFHANGTIEAWMPEGQISSPLARQMLISEAVRQVDALELEVAAARKTQEQATARCAELREAEIVTRRQRDDARQHVAQKDGEYHSVARETERLNQRFSAVSTELAEIKAQTSGTTDQQHSLTNELKKLADEREQGIERSAAIAAALDDSESRQTEISDHLTDSRLKHQALTQQLQHAAQQSANYDTRIEELERLLQGRSQGVRSYDDGIARLTAENEDLTSRLDEMANEAKHIHDCVDEGRSVRAQKGEELTRADAALAEVRRVHEANRDLKGRADLELAESRMYRQNHLERIYNEYGLNQEELIAAPDPKWPNGVTPEVTAVEPRVTDLQNQIKAMGPVNLVAIEEYKELEERYTFLKAQETDLVESKKQLFDLIDMINVKTSEMFKSTFEQANANFEVMFTKLFNGGTARLSLIENAEDPLECGIDIIAHPPGKRPQSITLLSGGERTMTAVSLLFAIFMIKPSPFALLDEIDAALDDSNIGRFVQALQGFLNQSQFLIITHNQHTIASADIVYGVTQQEQGVSKIISMKLHDIGTRELEVGEATPEPPPTIPIPPRRTRAKSKPTATDKVTETEETTEADDTDV